MSAMFSKIIALILCICLLFCGLNTYALADTTQRITLSLDVALSTSNSVWTSRSSNENLANLINKQLKEFKESVNIYSFRLRNTPVNQQKIVSILSGDLPECFHLGVEFSISVFNGYIYEICPTYIYNKREYNSMLAECEAVADNMLKDIENNSRLGDVEKLLLLHDKIALNCEYDYENYLNDTIPQISHSMYGVLVNGVGVCQGYALAYSYLLDRIGIENYYCGSSALLHAWNIVYVNGKPYHVDITWDDNPWDVTGRVSHDNFLVSTQKLIENGHYATDDYGNAFYDYDDSPVDETYDNYFWQNVESAFVYLNNEIYYIDEKSTQNVAIKRYSDNETLYQTEHYWMASATSYYSGNYAKLSVAGSKLLFSLSGSIYSFNPKNNEVKLIYSKPNTYRYYNIYGFNYANGNLICDIWNKPYFDINTKKNYEFKVPYHDPGNINGDGEVNLEDISVLARALSGWSTVSVQEAYDANGDGKANLLDIIHLARYVAGWEGIVLH